jgi:2-methylisocitrate lyase-like PEP mutase family enzyme
MRGVPLMAFADLTSPTMQEFRDLGYALVVYPLNATTVAMAAVKAAFQALRNTGTFAYDREEMVRFRREIEGVIGLPEYYPVEDDTTEKKRE